MKCFVLMPYADDYDAVFAAARAASANALPNDELDCVWLKDNYAAGRITDDIVSEIETATFCISDVSGNNANVMWETGYAMALRKPTILIGRDVEALPFDLKVHRVLAYSRGDLGALTDGLAKAIRQTLARSEVHTKIDPAIRPLGSSITIAVTGSTEVDAARARRRIATLIQPYLGRGSAWYCGSFGIVDELALRHLVSKGERAVAVGFDRFDFSSEVRQMIDAGKIGAVDASVESLPKGLAGPTPRDVLFASRADLAMLFWDGKSRGTGKLLDFLKSNGVNTLVGII
jgi:hypothetical protein